MIYNFNLGIGWASSGVEYAESYRAKMLREIHQPAKFVFTDMFPRDSLALMTENIGFLDQEIIWLYTYFTDFEVAKVTYSTKEFQKTLPKGEYRAERQGKRGRIFFDGSGNYVTLYFTDEEHAYIHRVEYVSENKLIRKDYFQDKRIYTEYYAPESGKAKLYMRRFFNRDGSTAYEEMLDAYIEQIFSDSDRIMKDNKSVKNALKKFTFPEGGYEEQLAYITERAGDIYGGVKPSDVVLEETQERFHDDERYSFSKPAGEGSGADVFVLNKAVADERKDLFTAVARDIFPGTMALESRQNADRAATYLTPSGVRDGAASFAEFSAYDLLDGEDRSVIDLKRNNSRSILLLCGKADLMANYYGKTKDEVNNFLTGYGVSDEAARSRIFNHINEVPGDYAARALGYVHILEMQRKAKDLKGEAYSDKAFYAFLTNYGDLPFKAMEKRLYLM